MKFENLDQLNEFFHSGDFRLPDEVVLGETVYTFAAGSNYSIQTMMLGAKPAYAAFLNEAEGKKNWLVFIWKLNEGAVLAPGVAKLIVESSDQVISEANGINPNNLIGDTVTVKFTSLPDTHPLRGKVDTGAEISSLHADEWKITGNKIQFVNRKLSPNVITMQLHDHQAVKSAQGTQYRPVVQMNIKINDRMMNGVLFNIADRSMMDHHVLVGKNILEKGKFLIDPSMTREGQEGGFDLTFLDEQIGQVEIPTKRQYNSEKARKVYETLKENNVSFADLIRLIRTEVVNTLED